MKVKCVNCTDLPAELTEGKIYEVISETFYCYKIKNNIDLAFYYLKSRFISDLSDKDDTLITKSKICPCGISRTDCDYHK